MKRSLVSTAIIVLVVLAAAQVTVGSVAADDVTLTIKTTDADGDARASVSFTASWDGGEVSDVTRSNGQYLLDVPEGANVTVEITDDRFVRNEPFEIENATTREVEIPVSLSATATVTVEGNNGPIADARVSISDGGDIVAAGRTGPNGNYTTPRVEVDNYAIRVTKAGYYDNSTSLFISGSAQTTVEIRTGAIEATFNVTDDHFDPPEPLEGANIEIPEAGTSLTTLDDGTRSTTLPVNRDYEVTVTKGGYQTTSTTLSVEERGVSFEVSTQRTPTMNLDVANDRVVIGETTRITVTNAYEEPIAEAAVNVDGATVGTTDQNGQFDAPIESQGSVTIEVTDGDLSASAEVEGVEPAEEATPTETATETATETTTETETATETTAEDGPGFGVLVSLVAIFSAGFLARRR